MTFAAAFVLLTLLGVVFARRAYQAATSWVQHTTDVKLAIDGARIDLEESAPRGADAAGFARVRDDVRRIRQLTRDNPRQQARLDELEPEVEAAGALARAGRLTDAQSDRLRALLAQMLAEEDALMSVRTAEQEAQRQRSWLVFGVCACLACAFAIAAILTLRRQSRALFRQSALFGAILESMGDGVLALDSERRFLVVNAALRRVFGDIVVGGRVSPEWMVAAKPLDADGAPLLVNERGPVVRALRGEAIDAVRFSILPPDGSSLERRWLSATCRPVRDEDDEIVAAVGILRDVTRERAERELLERQAEELRKQSLVDELTGLYNRRGFLFLANQYARTAARRKQRFAILFLDLNGLKAINDTFGHDVGDQAIRRMGKLLKATLRESDIAARLGGDEYVALIDGADEGTVTRILERIGRQIELEAKGKGGGYVLSASSGAAYQVADGARSIDDLLAEADRRMYAQKSKRGSDRARASA
jgi:diguanylate cyclase (GGDEF)-like protein